MSRTDAHAPLWVRVARHDVPSVEVHDHTDGVCDLPDPLDGDALWSRPGRCHWQLLWDGRGVCPCELCREGSRRRAERRSDRQVTSRQLRLIVDRWNAGCDRGLPRP